MRHYVYTYLEYPDLAVSTHSLHMASSFLPLDVPGLTSPPDIILSPFKPQRKNVTGDDVANSLYYIHLDSAADELLVPKSQRAEEQPRTSTDSARSDPHRIARKPLPVSAKVPQAPSQTLESPVDNKSIHDEQQVKYPPLSQTPQNKENIPIEHDTLPPPAAAKADPASVPTVRKPLGPRQMSMQTSSPPKELLSQPPRGVVRPASPPTPEEARPVLPPRRIPPPLRFDTRQAPTSFDEIRVLQSPNLPSPMTPSRSPSPWSNQKPFTPFTLTIIRRDPSTGHQWNIGKVHSFQSTIFYHDPQHPDAPPITQYPRGYPAINVHIETSGYARFRNFPTALPKKSIDGQPMSPVGGGGGVTQTMKELAAQMKAHDNASGMDDPEGGFRRQVVMGYGKTWTHNLKEAFMGRNRSSTSSSKTTDDLEHYNEPLQPPQASLHRREDSGASTASNDSTHLHPQRLEGGHRPSPIDTSGMDEPQPVISLPSPGLRPKGYTFTSPWDGRCEFRTSSSGRALKCQHIRNTTSQGFNPLVAAQALRDAASPTGDGKGWGRSRGMSASLANAVGGGDTGNRVPVSELRFNLPSADLFNNKEDRERAAKELTEGFGRLLVRSPGGHDRERDDNMDDDDDGEDRIFDFSSLGKEKAGGGNRGKRAKMGKLLVHDEGLKMLDLVVATNMGIWWQAWERSF